MRCFAPGAPSYLVPVFFFVGEIPRENSAYNTFWAHYCTCTHVYIVGCPTGSAVNKEKHANFLRFLMWVPDVDQKTSKNHKGNERMQMYAILGFCQRWCLTFYHGKSPLNHQLGEYVLLVPGIFFPAKSKYMLNTNMIWHMTNLPFNECQDLLKKSGSNRWESYHETPVIRWFCLVYQRMMKHMNTRVLPLHTCFLVYCQYFIFYLYNLVYLYIYTYYINLLGWNGCSWNCRQASMQHSSPLKVVLVPWNCRSSGRPFVE